MSWSLPRTAGLVFVLLLLSLPLSIAGGDASAILLVLLFLYALAKRQTQLPWNPGLWGLGVMILGFVLSSAFAADPAPAFWYSHRFWRYLIPLAERHPLSAFKLLLFSAMPLSLYAVAQYFTGLDLLRSGSLTSEYQPEGGIWYAVGAFSHHLTFGGVFLLLFGVALGLSFATSQPPGQRRLFQVAAALFFIAALMSHGRSIWLGLFLAILVVFGLRLPRRWVVGLVILALLFAGVLWRAQETSKLRRIFKANPLGYRILTALSAKSNRDRLAMWQAAGMVIQDHPWLGLGANATLEVQAYYDLVAHKVNHRFQHTADVGVHQLYLQTWIDFGLLGVVGLVLWLGWVPYAMLRIGLKAPPGSLDQGFALGLAAALLGSLLAGFFENNFRDGEVQNCILTLHGFALWFWFRAQKNA